MTPLRMSGEVEAARIAGRPLVALESTIITHGMPWPRNLEVARKVEDTIRRAGATPASTAVLGGELTVGLTPAQLERLARAEGVAKLSRADLPVCIATGGTGATTVAATMIAARAAGIETFATGGIGGVHRGADQSFDVSADLHELARTPVIVVSAGAKAILDLPKTFEMLETLGVPVVAYGQEVLPAFWSRRSDVPAPLTLHAPAEIARSHAMRGVLKLQGGMLVANPIPQDSEIGADELAPLIGRALDEAAAGGIASKDVTPFLLSRVFEMTDGRSLEANVALVLNNARLAAAIAHEIAAIRVSGAGGAAPPL